MRLCSRALLLLAAVLLVASCTQRSDPSPSPRAHPIKLTQGFVALRASTFTMGSPDDEPDRYTNEARHEVTLTRDFELAATEVRQSEFQAVMGYNPSHFAGCPTCPVETVSWSEAAAYCNGLSRRAALAACYACEGSGPSVKCEVAPAHAGSKIYDCPGYRLPTDAEWEYAYRAGTRTLFYNGTPDTKLLIDCGKVESRSDEIAWYCANAGQRTHPAGTKKPNAWGLHDLAGNVWEWCHDGYRAVLGAARAVDPSGLPGSPMRVVRGGAWKYYGRGLRAAARAWYPPTYRGSAHGFRVARTGRAP